jgi:hypothetical protein
LRARLRRRWEDGSLLGCFARGEPFPAFDLPLHGPRASDIGADLGAVQRWISAVEAGSRRGACYELTYAPIGGRLIGRNQIPSRALVSTYAQAWTLLGVANEVRRLEKVLLAAEHEPAAREWIAAHPIRAIGLKEQWPTLLAAYRWLDEHRGSGRYLREISAPGVDTKFVERHRGVLAELLDVPSNTTGLLAGLGLAAKPEMLRLRVDPTVWESLPFSDITAPVQDLRALPIQPDIAVIVENEVSFLSIPVPLDGVVLWGKGFEVDRAGSLPWLRESAVLYWGDLDTHGFAILDRLRAWLPQTRSFLMDSGTLLAHRDRWVTEATPTRARLERLTDAEGALYLDLIADRYGERIRLEQERIDWGWAKQRFPFS